MKWENFTAGRVASFKCVEGKKQSIFWDGKTPGLGLRVTAGGARSFIFETSIKGRTLRITIGDVSTYSIDAAQKIAKAYRAQTDQGIDPRLAAADKLASEQAARQARQAEAEAKQAETDRKGLTLAQVWPLYIAARKAKWSTGHIQNHLTLSAAGGLPKKRGKGLTVAGPMASLMTLPLSDLTAERIATWLEFEALSRPTNAAQSYRLLRAFIHWASDVPAYRGIIATDVCAARVVRDVLPKSQAKEGDSLQREQLPAWFDAVLKISNPVISSYLQCLLLTGARREELAGLRWEDVDFKWNSIKLNDKVDDIRIVPLTPYVSSLLASLPRRNEWVFSSPTAANGRLTEPRIAHTKALAGAGLPHVSLHGLRRSFGTLSEWLETPTGISAQIMGHKPSALAEKHYRRRPIDLLRMWHEKIEIWILGQAEIDFVSGGPRLRVVAAA
jgi:integrase